MIRRILGWSLLCAVTLPVVLACGAAGAAESPGGGTGLAAAVVPAASGGPRGIEDRTARAARRPAKKARRADKACGPQEVPSGASCYRYQAKGPYGRCEPQSLPYGRCRTGIMRCRGSCETSPIGWFGCERTLGKTSERPESGCILILGGNSKHRINTGHVFVVEQARDLGGGLWGVTLSHTNHDRRCSLETGVQAIYDEKNKTVSMKTGAWSAWGKNLKALGCILR